MKWSLPVTIAVHAILDYGDGATQVSSTPPCRARTHDLRAILIILFATIMVMSDAGYAQFRNQNNISSQVSANADSVRGDSIFRKTYATLNAGAIGWQFLAGEVAFNVTSFALWADDLYRGSTGNELDGFGILASMVTVPLAIHFTSQLLHLKTGLVPAAMLGAFLAFFLITLPILATLHHPISYLTSYLGVSLPLIGIAQLVYDLTLP